MTATTTDWKAEWDASLMGLLSLHVDEHEDLLAPVEHLWLVLHLNLLKCKQNAAATFNTTLEAMAELFTRTELARVSASQHTALWRRILTSRMMVMPMHDNNAALLRATRPIRGQTPRMRVLLDLSGVDIQSGFARVPLTSFLHKKREPHVRRMTLGVRMARCRLRADEIASVDALFTGCSIDPSALIASTIGWLDFSDNGLTPDSLGALSSLLRHHAVENLQLENALGRVASKETVAGFKSVLHSVLSTKETGSTPLSLSFGGNSFSGVYFESIADALQTTRRPLRSLSLARTFAHSTHVVDRALIWRQLTRIFIAQERSYGPQEVTSVCELDLSGNSAFQQDADIFQQTYLSIIDSHIETMRQALSNGSTVWCRVAPGACFYSGPTYSSDSSEVGYDAPQHRVVDASVDGWILVAAIDGMAQDQWITAGAIAELRVGDSDYLLRPRFSSLIVDDLRISDSRVLAHVLTPIGFRLHKLSLHIVFTAYAPLPAFLQLCPHLTHLDIEGCRLYDATDVWNALRDGSARSLQSLNMAGNLIGLRGTTGLVQLLREVPELRLRRVKLNQNHIGLAGLQQLADLLQHNETLEIVELDGAIERDVEGAYAAQRRLLSESYQGQRLATAPLPRDARLAFFHVLTVLSQRYSSMRAMDTPVVALIVEFAADPVTRQLQWLA